MKIRADRHDTHDQDLADSIEQALNRNGENTPSTNIGWGNHRIANLGDGNSADDAATLGQVQSQIAGVAQASGTDALTATFSPALTALTDKTTVYVRAAAANTSTTPTFAPNGLAAKTITKEGNQALVAGDIAGAAHVLILQYISSNDVWELLNPVNPPTEILTGGGAFPNVDADVTATDEELNKTDGLTATTAELNKLDGVTATTAELNKTDGITGQILTSGNDGPVYTGRVDVSVPEMINGPSGWTLTKDTIGQYTITHSLGLSNKANLIASINPLPTTNQNRYGVYNAFASPDANNATIFICDDSDGILDEDFQFMFINTEET